MNLLFHHLQKCAGTSITWWVSRHLGAAMIEFGPRGRSGTLPENAYKGRSVAIPTSTGVPVRAVMGHYVSLGVALVLGWEPASYASVTTIRDPAERLFSQYKNFERRAEMGAESFEEWVERGRNPRICYCLECQFDGFEHIAEPMCHFFGSRVPEVDPGKKDVLARAKRFLEQCRIYMMSQIPQLVADLAQRVELGGLGINPDDYKPEYVFGEGEKVTQEHRRLVAKNHPMDAELYHWARRLKKKREPLAVTA